MALTKAAAQRREAAYAEDQTLSPTIAVTWPNFVSRVELDVHFKSFDDQMKEVLRRLAQVESQNNGAVSQLQELNDLCRDHFASKQTVASAESRLALDVALCQKETEESLAELRQCGSEDVAAARAEFGQRLSELREDLRGVVASLSNVDTELKQSVATTAATYATKVALDTNCLQLRSEQLGTRRELDLSIETIDARKASTNDLQDVRAALEQCLASLRADVANNGTRINAASDDLVQLRRHCQDELMPKGCLDDLEQGLKSLQESTHVATKERNVLRKDVDWDREKLLKGLDQQREQGDHLRTAFRNHRDLDVHLSSLITDVTVKYDSLTDGLGKFEQRHQCELEACQRQSELQRQAHETLKDSHEALHLSLTSHRDAQKIESERLRHHSTHHFIDQMDKALKIQQSVSKIEEGHMELNERLQSIKLPKV